MPIKIPDGLPAIEALEKENIFVMTEGRAAHQDIRPLKIAVMNLMPTKITTETQLIRLLSNTSLQIELTLLSTESHRPTHTSYEHMSSFYRFHSGVADERFDGLIITGAPVEDKKFEDVDYWDELVRVLEWAKSHVYSTLCICWAAQAALYHYYGIEKHHLDKKMFGVFRHRTLLPYNPLVRGFDEIFYAPHSRHTEVKTEDIEKCPSLDILASSEKAGPYLIANRDFRRVFVIGHGEYDTETLAGEYFRDKNKNLDINIPDNYFPDDDPSKTPINRWRGHANLLFSNWLGVVYQQTPYDLSALETEAE